MADVTAAQGQLDEPRDELSDVRASYEQQVQNVRTERDAALTEASDERRRQAPRRPNTNMGTTSMRELVSQAKAL